MNTILYDKKFISDMIKLRILRQSYSELSREPLNAIMSVITEGKQRDI